MNKLDKQYTDLLKDILENGTTKSDRTGTGTISVFGRQLRHDFRDGFPLLTTKRMPFKTIVTELLWFLRGDTNIKFLVDNGCHIWDGDAYKNYKRKIHIEQERNGVIGYEHLTKESFIERIKTDNEFANKWGELGPIYGKQWRSWEVLYYDKTLNNTDSDIECYRTYIDQIANLINDLKTNPDSRRLMVNAWNVGELDSMVLPPCHYGFQVYTRELSLEERFNIVAKREGTTLEETKHTWGWDTDKETHDDMTSNNIPTRAISLSWNQRSVDTFLGLPFNIASYGLLLEIIAKAVNMVPDELIGNLGDVHLYSNHVEQAKEQIGRELTHDERVDTYSELGLTESTESSTKRYINKEQFNPYVPKRTREPYPLPTLNINSGNENWHLLDIDDIVNSLDNDITFKLENYQSHPTIKAPLSN